MKITLSSGTIVEIKNINLAGGQVDWRRQDGYAGDCTSYIIVTDLVTAEATIKAALDAEGI